MSSIKEIARQVGISPASVSIYLNDKKTNRVSAKTKTLIDKAVKDLNYHKNIFASCLSTHESKMIGIIIPTILPLFQNDYTNALLAGVQTRLSFLGYGMLFFPSSAQSSIEIVKEQLEKSIGCDGYILFSTGFCTLGQIQKNIKEVEKTERPFVTLNIPKIDDDVNQVLLDDLDKPKGAQYLLDKGHRNLLLVLGRHGGEHTRHLQNNYKKLLKEYEVPYEAGRVLHGEYSDEKAYTVVREALKQYPDTTAICCMSDIMAASSIKAVEAIQKTIPDDISIIGRNNSVHAKLSSPALTTIDLHMQQVGSSAANLLLDALSGNNVKQKIFMTGSLIERDSVRSLV